MNKAYSRWPAEGKNFGKVKKKTDICTPEIQSFSNHFLKNMPTKIRLQRKGKKGQPFYHLVVADGRAPRDGKYIERLGTYNPMTNPATIDIVFDRALYWVQVGAQPSDTARSILSNKGVLLKNHLLKGVAKGALTEEQAEEKFQAWMKEKEEKQSRARTEQKLSEKEEDKKRLDAEKKIAETRAEELAKKRAKLAEAEQAKRSKAAAEVTEEVKGEEPAAEAKEEKAEEPVAEAKEEKAEEPVAEAKEEKAEEPAAEAKEEKAEEPAAEVKEEKAEEPAAEAKEEDKPEEEAPPKKD